MIYDFIVSVCVGVFFFHHRVHGVPLSFIISGCFLFPSREGAGCVLEYISRIHILVCNRKKTLCDSVPSVVKTLPEILRFAG